MNTVSKILLKVLSSMWSLLAVSSAMKDDGKIWYRLNTKDKHSIWVAHMSYG